MTAARDDGKRDESPTMRLQRIATRVESALDTVQALSVLAAWIESARALLSEIDGLIERNDALREKLKAEGIAYNSAL